MHQFTQFPSLALLLSATASASQFKRQTQVLDVMALGKVCSPTNSSGEPDLNAPCNAVQALQLQCIYGIPLSQAVSPDGGPIQHSKEQSKDDQRICACQSDMFEQISGCADCYKAHGGDISFAKLGDKVDSLSSSYCAASATPTANLANYFFEWSQSQIGGASSSMPASSSSSSFSDPIGNKTQVSLYFTPSVTGSAAYDAGYTTGAGADKVTTTNVVDGQIEATNTAASGGSGSGSGSGGSGSGSGSGGSGTSGGGASPSPTGGAERLQAAAAGVIGLAGLVALL